MNTVEAHLYVGDLAAAAALDVLDVAAVARRLPARRSASTKASGRSPTAVVSYPN